MNSSLELDNETLRLKLQDLRKANSSLVTENHRLVERLETTVCELRNSSSRVRILEDSVESYRLKSHELNGVLTAFERVSKSSESDCEKSKQKYEQCSRQLAESVDLLRSQSAAIESLKKEVDELRSLQAKTEDERNVALDTAEKIQRSYEDLQTKFKKTLSSSEEEANLSHKERTQLHEDLEGRCSQVKALQDDIKNLRAEINVQKNARRENEQRNADLRSQTKNQSSKIEKLEQDLENQKKLKLKNGEMKTVMDQQRKRIASLEAEIHGVNSKLSQLESVLQFSKKTSIKSKNSAHGDGTLASGIASKTDKNWRNGAFDADKLVATESELRQLRSDVLRLAGGFSELSGKDLSVVLNGARPDKGSVEECQATEKLESNEAFGDPAALLSSVEKRLSNFESMNARLVSHIAQLSAQMSETEKSGNERSAKQERELQKREQQIALLENQLDDKVREMATHAFELNSVKAELERSRADCEAVRVELEAKYLDCQRMMSDANRLRELHSEHCVELEGQIAMVEKEREETRDRLEKVESRCRAMQQSLSQTIDISDALKDDLESCRRLESMVLEAEKRSRDATDRAVELEEELILLRRENDVRTEKARAVEDGYRGKLEECDERLRACEERLGRAEEQVGVGEGEITRLLRELNRTETSLRENAERTEAVERERSHARSHVSELEKTLEREMSRLESLLDGAEEKLEEALEEISRKNGQIADLTRKNSDACLQKTRMDELSAKSEESDKLRLELEAELDRANGDSRRQTEEIEMLRVVLKERESAVEDLQGRVVRAYKELQARTKADKRSFAEVEQLKAEAHTRDSHLAEAARKAELQDRELGSCRERLASVQSALTQCKEELQRSRSEIETLNAKLQEMDWDVEQKSSRISQLEHTLNERLSVLSESEQTRLRFEGALQRNQLDSKQHEKRASDLEDQLHDLLALVKEQCLKIQADETANKHLSAELDSRNARFDELERTAENLRRELERTASVNRRAETELCASREHIQKLHGDLVGARQDLASLRSQHDRLAKDLAEAVALLQQKDSELARLLETLSDAEECRSDYTDRIEELEEANRTIEATYNRLKKVDEAEIAVRGSENEALRRDLVASNSQQRHLAKRVAQLTEQVARLQTLPPFPDLKSVENATGLAKTKMTSSSKIRSERRRDTAVSESSDCTSRASLSDVSILSNLESSETGRSRKAERDKPQAGHTSSSGRPGHSVEPAQRGSNPGDVPWNSESHSSFAIQRCEENDRSSSNFFQTMWNALLNSEIDDRELPGYGPMLFSEQDESRSTMCTPVHDSDQSASVVDRSAPAIYCSIPVSKCSAEANNGTARVVNLSAPSSNSSASTINCSALATNCSALTGNSSNLIVYHLSPSGKRSASLINNSDSIQPLNDPNFKSSRHKPQHQNSSKSQTIDFSTEPNHKQPQTPNAKRSESLFTTRLTRSATKPSKKSGRSHGINESPFSPIFANRHSPNPTTAISYYERILPSSKSDAEVERIIGGRDFCDSERFLSISDE